MLQSCNILSFDMSKKKLFPVANGKTTLGMHLMLDAYDVPFDRLNDMKLIYKFLYEIPEKIGMCRLSTPLIANADESASHRDPGGISGVILIKESHISIHTFAKRGFFTFDLYSCSNFENHVKELLRYIKKTFPFKEHELQIVKRGLQYPTINK